ncbi:hypothetical protein RBH29_13695 [Herbivorax sp. ANBcel31]|uniref:hypothetical protein n=1 Tax=Herbivorax sp. ANBcel31 TaxID=3069754 RepID=UPI0027B58D63|nr:hypothetical protein [Herbivorax sp. ANBcel31]MDQ2087480.1 hypothetical protein [Herbivorax sp. ANBcel31]
MVAGLIRFGFNYADTGDFWGSIGKGIKTAGFVMCMSFAITLVALKFPYLAKAVVIVMLSYAGENVLKNIEEGDYATALELVTHLTAQILLSKILGPYIHKASTSGEGTGKDLSSVDDIISNPKNLYGKSKSDVSKILGDGWTEGAYGSSKTGWKFTKGDQSIFYHPGGGVHVGSYYGYSSGATGKIKIVGSDYVPISGDKARVINVE